MTQTTPAAESLLSDRRSSHIKLRATKTSAYAELVTVDAAALRESLSHRFTLEFPLPILVPFMLSEATKLEVEASISEALASIAQIESTTMAVEQDDHGNLVFVIPSFPGTDITSALKEDLQESLGNSLGALAWDHVIKTTEFKSLNDKSLSAIRRGDFIRHVTVTLSELGSRPYIEEKWINEKGVNVGGIGASAPPDEGLIYERYRHIFEEAERLQELSEQ